MRQDRPGERTYSRRDLLRFAGVLALGASGMASLISACSSAGGGHAGAGAPSDTPTTEASLIPQRGGTLQVALTGDPPSLDLSRTTDSVVMLVTSHIYETLFTWDAEYRPAPLLAETHEIREDGLVHRLTLRAGVPFHNGEEMQARDVIASIERWSTQSSLGEDLQQVLDDIIEVDSYTIELRLQKPFGTMVVALARQLQGCAIYPASVLEASTETQLHAYVGTGPYQLVDWQPDRRLRVERFDDYVSPPGASDGYAGAKDQYLDAIEFVPVRSEASRVAGIQTETYHYLETVSPDQVPALSSSGSVEIDILRADSWLNVVLNLRSPVLTDIRVRRAIQVALDHTAILQAAFGEGYYELSPELLPGATPWYSDAGAEFFNRNDPDEARRLLAGVAYDATPLRFLATQEIQQEYNATLTMKQQLEAVGLVVDLQVYDGATLSDRRNDDAAWELYTAWASFRPDPIMRNLSSSASGWWEDDEKDRLLANLQSESDPAKRFIIWEQIQQRFYEDVPRLKIGNSRRVVVRSTRLHGIGPTEMQPEFSNAWLGG